MTLQTVDPFYFSPRPDAATNGDGQPYWVFGLYAGVSLLLLLAIGFVSVYRATLEAEWASLMQETDDDEEENSNNT